MKSYRTAGHESFPFRYTWLPKAVQNVAKNGGLLADDDKAMVEFGLGKNMVRSLRFWAQCTGLIKSPERGWFTPTDFGRAVLGEDGLDPFLEDTQTLWLIHWQLSRHGDHPLLGWDFLLNRWHEPELVPSKVMPYLVQELSNASSDAPSLNTVERHLDVFFRTYVAGKGKKGKVLEDNLDCPLVELDLIEVAGSRQVDGGSSARSETVYRFRREEKADISPALFSYCLCDYWERHHESSQTLSLKELAHGHGSPGQVFKIPEEDVRHRMETLGMDGDSPFTYSDSATLPSLQRIDAVKLGELLEKVYVGKEAYA